MSRSPETRTTYALFGSGTSSTSKSPVLTANESR
jgi:hypothetical protein